MKEGFPEDRESRSQIYITADSVEDASAKLRRYDPDGTMCIQIKIPVDKLPIEERLKLLAAIKTARGKEVKIEGSIPTPGEPFHIFIIGTSAEKSIEIHPTARPQAAPRTPRISRKETRDPGNTSMSVRKALAAVSRFLRSLVS